MTRGRVRHGRTAPVSPAVFLVLLWLAVAGTTVGLYGAGAFG